MPRHPESESTGVPLTVHQGDDKRWILQLKRSNGAPFDLNGYTAAAQFRNAIADDPSSVAVESLVEVTNPDNGEVTMTLRSEETRLLVLPEYAWELEIVDESAWTTTILRGTLAVTKEITRTSG